MKHGIMLIGCGNMAGVHCQALAKMDNVRLVSAIDIDKERAQKFQELFGFERIGTDYRTELEKNDIDIVLCCTCWQIRFDILKTCIDAGKHILAEKPLSVFINELEALFQLANEHHVKIRVGMMERFRPMFLKIGEFLRQDIIGKPMVFNFIHHQSGWGSAIDASWEYQKHLLSGGLTPNIDCGIHKCDLTRWLSGSDPASVFSVGQKLESDSPGNNFAHSVFTMEDGTTLTLEDCFSRNTRPLIYMWIIGDKGKIRFEYSGHHDHPFPNSEEDVIRIWHRQNACNETIHTQATMKPVGPQMETFIKEIEEDSDMEWHYKNVRKATEMVCASALSERRNSIVKFPLTDVDIAETDNLFTK